MAKIHIMQLLCPLRHCIVGIAFDPETTGEEKAKSFIEAMMETMKINRWCALCHSEDLHFEVGTTKHDSMPKILPDLMEEVRKNGETRTKIDAIRRAAKNN